MRRRLKAVTLASATLAEVASAAAAIVAVEEEAGTEERHADDASRCDKKLAIRLIVDC
jgi:hypothetical protein